MNENYPKWVQRAPGIGAVLCNNVKEEQKLLEDWDAEKLKEAEAAAAEAQADAKEAEEGAKLTLKMQGGKK